MSNKRIDYLDQIKGFSILLVVFCHYVLLPNDTVLGNIIMCVAWGAVPCFFMVTGGLMHQKSSFAWKNYLYKLLKTYLVLCIWKLIYYIYYHCFMDISISKAVLVEYLFFFRDVEGVSTGFLWFMYAYINVLLLYPISYYLFKGKKEGQNILLFSTLLLFVTSILTTSGNFILEIISEIANRNVPKINFLSRVIPFGGYEHMLFYFVIGAFVFEKREWIKQKSKKVCRLPSILFLILMMLGTFGLMFIKWKQTGSFTWSNTYLKNGYYWISTMFVAFGIYGLFLNLEKEYRGLSFLKKIGKETLGIYYLHYIILYIYIKYWNLYFEEYNSVAANILKTAIVVVLCLAITKVLKKILVIRKLVA